MTQEKHTQQDKIDEIMGLVETYGEVRENYGANRTIDAYSDSSEYRSKIESKLRELVREPLSDEQVRQSIKEFKVANDLLGVDHIHVARAIERAHNITNTSGEE